MNKKECEKAVKILEEEPTSIADIFNKIGALGVIDNLIKEHFDPQPYKFEELHEGMWVWDDVEKKCNKIININTVKLLLPTSNSDKKIGFYYITENPLRYIVEFEENRFFPVTKAKGE